MLDAVQVFGGYGYMTEQGIERDLRDAVGSTLYSGTTEIQRNIIAKMPRAVSIRPIGMPCSRLIQ